MSNFGNIFSDLPDDLTGWLKLGVTGYTDYEKIAEETSRKTQELASLGGRAGSTRERFQSSQSTPAKAVDPMAYESMWRSRLSAMVEDTKVSSAQPGKSVKLGKVQ